jgi:hypothetical protein
LPSAIPPQAVTDAAKPALRTLAERLQSELEAAVMAAIVSRGHSVQTLADFKGRLFRIRKEGVKGETFTLDGKPLLWAGDVEIVHVGGVPQATRRIQMFGPEEKGRTA